MTKEELISALNGSVSFDFFISKIANDMYNFSTSRSTACLSYEEMRDIIFMEVKNQTDAEFDRIVKESVWNGCVDAIFRLDRLEPNQDQPFEPLNWLTQMVELYGFENVVNGFTVKDVDCIVVSYENISSLESADSVVEYLLPLCDRYEIDKSIILAVLGPFYFREVVWNEAKRNNLCDENELHIIYNEAIETGVISATEGYEIEEIITNLIDEINSMEKCGIKPLDIVTFTIKHNSETFGEELTISDMKKIDDGLNEPWFMMAMISNDLEAFETIETAKFIDAGYPLEAINSSINKCIDWMKER